MPRLAIEYTDNLAGLDADGMRPATNRFLASGGRIAECDINSRTRRLETWRVGEAEVARGFVHAALALLHRDDATQAQLSAGLLQVLGRYVPPLPAAVQPCVAVERIHGPAHSKSFVEPSGLHDP